MNIHHYLPLYDSSYSTQAAYFGFIEGLQGNKLNSKN